MAKRHYFCKGCGDDFYAHRGECPDCRSTQGDVVITYSAFEAEQAAEVAKRRPLPSITDLLAEVASLRKVLYELPDKLTADITGVVMAILQRSLTPEQLSAMNQDSEAFAEELRRELFEPWLNVPNEKN